MVVARNRPSSIFTANPGELALTTVFTTETSEHHCEHQKLRMNCGYVQRF
jgi:hypothetical protein